MGWAKYYEDNMSIYVGRMVMKESVTSYNVKVKPTHAVQIQIAQKKKPVILATGASSIQDVQRAYQTIQQYENRIVLMQCNTNYTAKVENYKYINLNVLKNSR